MFSTDPPVDLTVLVADKNMEAAFRAILERRSLRFKIAVHPNSDSGVFRKGAEILRAHLRSSRFALVVLDREGCGSQNQSEVIEVEIENRLRINGWENRSAAICIDPELEAQVWASNLDWAIGWSRSTSMRAWLRTRDFFIGDGKPSRPKEALEAALVDMRIPRSSALYGHRAKRLDPKGCQDRAYRKLHEVISHWFDAAGKTSA